IPDGIDLGRVKVRRSSEAVRRELGVAADALVTGMVGPLSARQGHVTFLEAAALIRDARPDARFLIVGDGRLERELRRAAARLGLGDACLFAGGQTDVHDVIAAMDIFVSPSLDECVPTALLEAMALERPVVATEVGGVPEIVQPRITGLLVEPGDARAIADACLEVAANTALADALRTRARDAVEARFTAAHSGKALMEAYRGVALIPKSAPRFRQQPSSDPPFADGAAQFDSVGRLVLQTLPRLAGAVLRRLRDALAHAIELRRARRLRRNPSAAAAAV